MLGKNGTVIFWRTGSWAELLRVEKMGEVGSLANFAVLPTLPLMAVRGSSDNEINIWELNLALLRGAAAATPSVFYVLAESAAQCAGRADPVGFVGSSLSLTCRFFLLQEAESPTDHREEGGEVALVP